LNDLKILLKGGEKMEEQEERIYGAAVVAVLFRRPDGRVFYVKRRGRQFLTFPTGHMKRADGVLRKTLFRESQEEVFKINGEIEALEVNEKQILEVFIRSRNEDHDEDKIITLYLWEVSEIIADSMRYEEKGVTEFVWIEPTLALSLPDGRAKNFGIPEELNIPLDDLGREGSKVYLEKNPVISKEGGIMRKIGLSFLEKFKLIFKKT